MEKTHYFLCANLFPAEVAEPNIVNIKGHNFTRVKLDARKCIILSCLFIKLKDEAVFSCFSDLHCYSKRMAGN